MSSAHPTSSEPQRSPSPEDVVDRVIRHSRAILACDPTEADAAHRALTLIRADLAARGATGSQLEELDAFLHGLRQQPGPLHS
ncbi:hypothetical protein AncyloWKF20_19275 [Ancylobacter sp. WKF20]|uniref:hypothetical protein n=1 Tax=Ancylobacter sp. WKF20 TaxID=3039801 RepID=UPI0024343291|nr:hypothetical protein [Ancylobacter sp. WKF20]WGD29868.1 hypothetical protein AncyloWKF20_19275 [Ancylobacter sp. WKF20]